MQTITIPLALCNFDVPKECLHIYCWCVYLTQTNNDNWFHLDFNYLKTQTGYSVKKLSIALNFLAKIRLIELQKTGSKQFGRSLINDIPESFLIALESKEAEYANLKRTKENLRSLNYLDPASILKNT